LPEGQALVICLDTLLLPEGQALVICLDTLLLPEGQVLVICLDTLVFLLLKNFKLNWFTIF
jgi:hypothetical protein